MKRAFIFLTLLLVVGCQTPTVKGVVDQDARVHAFLTFFPDAQYAESTYSGAGLDAIRDVIVQDCGEQDLPDTLVRATYVSKAATLVVYVQNNKVFCVASKLNQDALSVRHGDPSTVHNGTLVTVNGVPITKQQLDGALASLPRAVRSKANRGALLNQLIDREVLRQAAADITVSPEEVENATRAAWEGAGFSDEESFRKALKARGVSYDAFLSDVESQLKVQKLLEKEGVVNVSVGEDAVKNFYLNNTNAFLVSEQVRFRQIFISFNKSGGREPARLRLQNVLQQLRSGVDFCAAVRRYSDDAASKDRCGEYVATRGVLLPVLEESLFSLSANQSTVVESPNGFHIFFVIERQPASVIPYWRAKQQVEGFLKDQLIQQRLNLFLLRLRADAEIVAYT